MFIFAFILDADHQAPATSHNYHLIFWIVFIGILLLSNLRKQLLRLKRWAYEPTNQGDYDTALKRNKMLLWIPGYGSSLEAMILAAAGRLAESMSCAKPRAFDKHGRPLFARDEFYYYVQGLSNNGGEPEAQPLFEAAIQLPQNSPRFHMGLATCLLDQHKEAERARGLVEQVLANANWKAPGEAIQAHRIAHHAWALASCGRRAEAEAKLQEAMSGSDAFETRLLAWLWFYAGKTYLALDDLEKARTAFQKANSLQPYGDIAVYVQKRLLEVAKRS
jgi:tetratricopeptide (TPR) repeat protein